MPSDQNPFLLYHVIPIGIVEERGDQGCGAFPALGGAIEIPALMFCDHQVIHEGSDWRLAVTRSRQGASILHFCDMVQPVIMPFSRPFHAGVVSLGLNLISPLSGL